MALQFNNISCSKIMPFEQLFVYVNSYSDKLPVKRITDFPFIFIMTLLD